MHRLLFIALITCVLVFPAQRYGIAGETVDAKQVLIQKVSSLSGEGAEISAPLLIPDIEKKEMEKIAQCQGCPQQPFGYGNKDWEKFKAQYKDGDVILFFHTNNESWNGLHGAEGYALIRGMEIVDTVIGKMN